MEEALIVESRAVQHSDGPAQKRPVLGADLDPGGSRAYAGWVACSRGPFLSAARYRRSVDAGTPYRFRASS